MIKQTDSGKAFEYSVLSIFDEILSLKQNVCVVKDESYLKAEGSFLKFPESERSRFKNASYVAAKHLLQLEPRISHPSSHSDILQLSIVPDSLGIQGDVRDVLIIRKLNEWEIGISAKNHHRAIKHSRLSDTIDFGKGWLKTPCSPDYFQHIRPIFEKLRILKKENVLWRDLRRKEDEVYVPLLENFRKELLRLEKMHPADISKRLLHYLIGKKDFYKVVKGRNKTTLQAFNLNGTLNKRADKIKPALRTPRLSLPTRIIELSFKNRSKNTLILTCDQGWQISFRIHNASSEVEPSLKFDINLIGHPQSLYTHHVSWT